MTAELQNIQFIEEGGRCSSSVRMVSCVSNYLQSLITDAAANKPHVSHAEGDGEERGEVLSE